MFNFLSEWLKNRRFRNMSSAQRERLVEDARVEVRMGMKKINRDIIRMVDKCVEAKRKGNDDLAEAYRRNAARLMTFSEKMEKVDNILDMLITMASTVDGYARLGQVFERTTGAFNFDMDFTSIGRSVTDMDNILKRFETMMDNMIEAVDSNGVTTDNNQPDENTKKHFIEIDKLVTAKLVPLSPINPIPNPSEGSAAAFVSDPDPVGGVKGIQDMVDEVNDEDPK